MSDHGTVSRYNNDSCRCDECREAFKVYRREYKARKASGNFVRLNAKGTNVPIPHGTTVGYNHHKCRCTPCRDARAEYQRAKRARLRSGQLVTKRISSVPVEPLWARVESASGTRIKDLNLYEIAEMCGVTRPTVARWQRSGFVSLRMTDRVAVSLGWHPAAIWGADWYISTASEAA